jgi:outer membrane lipoprotein-sorting protein
MRRRSLLTCLAAPGALAAVPPAQAAATLTADQILAQVRDRPDGRDACADLTLALTEADGGRRERHLLYLQKKVGRDDHLTLYFTGPAEVKGVGLQSISHDEADGRPDEQWIYLPAFRQVRRIAANDKRGAFMGSQFAYIDLDRLRVSDYRQTLVGEEKVLERDCHVIERIPVSSEVIGRTGYHKLRVWVDKQTFIILRQSYGDAGGLMFKQYDAQRVERIQDIWTVMEGVMTDRVSRRSSTLLFSKVRYNLGLADALFQQDILKTGISHASLPALR